MSPSSTPIDQSIDYSLLQDILSSSEPFDQAYFSEPYHTSPDYPLDPFLDTESFSPTVPSIEPPNINPASLTHTPHETSTSPYNSALVDPSRPTHTSPTPSTCSASLSPRGLKRESPSSPSSNPPCKRAQQPSRPRRQPHNQVERKYREGLNAALERLRRAVPSLETSPGDAGAGQAKISKATILVKAIEYIKTVERERDELREENKRLREGRRGGGNEVVRGSGTMWMGRGGEDLLDGFMMDY